MEGRLIVVVLGQKRFLVNSCLRANPRTVTDMCKTNNQPSIIQSIMFVLDSTSLRVVVVIWCMFNSSCSTTGKCDTHISWSRSKACIVLITAAHRSYALQRTRVCWCVWSLNAKQSADISTTQLRRRSVSSHISGNTSAGMFYFSSFISWLFSQQSSRYHSVDKMLDTLLRNPACSELIPHP